MPIVVARLSRVNAILRLGRWRRQPFLRIFLLFAHKGLFFHADPCVSDWRGGASECVRVTYIFVKGQIGGVEGVFARFE